MAIEDIFIALEEQGEQESREALDAAREQARGIKEDAEEQAKTIRGNKTDAARAHAALKTARTINSARLEGRRAVAGVKERAIVQSFDEALDKLASVRKSPDYPGLFRALAAEAVEGLDGEVTFVVDPADAALAAQVLAELALNGTVDATASTRGGLTVMAQGGSMLRRNTLEDRLAKFRLGGQSEIAEVLSA
jgi:V/A-type H+-transporting ATPase subunit E